MAHVLHLFPVMNMQQLNGQDLVGPVLAIVTGERAQGTIQRVDTLGREIAILLSTGLEIFYVPPDCPIILHGERIKLRMIQPRDEARVTFDRSSGMLVMKLLEVQPDSGFSCFRL
jgi:hypothetical protein